MNTSDSRKNQWIAGGAVLVMLLAGGSIARIYSLQRQASASDLRSQKMARMATLDARASLSPEEQAKRLKLVTRLRETWKPWAEKHQKELRRMLSASPSDTVARDVVWNAVPITPFQPGGSQELDEALNNGGNRARGETFTWNAISRPRKPSQVSALTADEKSRYKREMTTAKWSIHNEFVEQRDLVISQSIQTGKVAVSLWVSGRVTEDSFDRIVTSPEGIGLPGYKRKEILPPYDFLTSE